MATAKNLKSIVWNSPLGITGFQSSRVYGVLNASGTHVLATNRTGSPYSVRTLQTAKLIAPHANKLASNGHHHWMPISTK